MTIQIKGRFKAIGEKKELQNGKTITKFYMDLDVDTQYPTVCEIQNYDDKVDLSGLKPGDPITAHVNLSGRKWTNPEGKSYFFQSLNVWKIEKDNPAAENTQPDTNVPDDLPF